MTTTQRPGPISSATPSGKFFDSDSGRFGSPHADAMDADRRARVVRAIERLLATAAA